jgi:hypothetical protein
MIALVSIMIILAPVLALFRFEWYHDGVESFGGNLSGGLDADDKEVWYANFGPDSPSAMKISVFDVEAGDWTKSFSGGPEGMPVSEFRFIELGGSRVLVGGPSGGALYDRDADSWTAYSTAQGLPSFDVYSGALREGEIWFGTNQGVAIQDSSGNWRYITTEDGLPNSKVIDFEFDGDAVWICTEGGILWINLETEEKRTYGVEDGMPGNVARRALVDGNNVWFAMKGGIARLDKSTGTISSYTMSSHNLLSNEVKDIAVLGDRIYFATGQGVNYRSREKETKFKKITSKQGLPDSPQRRGMGSDATHLAAQGEYLWIALWYEGIVRMSIPTGLGIIPIWVWVVSLSALGIIALIVIRPGGKKEPSERDKMVEERRQKVKTRKPPHEVCGGVPQRQLCNRCKFNTLKAGKLFCGKYNIPIEYKKPAEEKDESESPGEAEPQSGPKEQ